MKKGLILMLLCALVLTLATGCSAKDETLFMEVEDIVATGDNQILTLNIHNDTGSTISYGWVGSCEIKVTTDEGRYVCDAPLRSRIPQGHSTEKIKLTDCPGEVKKIVITELCQLNKSGLPEKELHNLTVYNSKKGVTSFEESFGFFDDPNWFSGIMFKLIPVFILFGIVIKVFQLFGGNLGSIFRGIPTPSFHQQTTQMMHDQAVQMANDAHMQEVNRQFHEDIHRHTQEAMDFGRQSVTPIDQGGFVPPPEPPMFF